MEKKLYRIWFVLVIVFHLSVIRCIPEELRFPLPQLVVVERYEVTIEHNIDDPILNYSGEVRMQMHCSNPTKRISFHQAREITVKAIELESLSKKVDSHFTVIKRNYIAADEWELILDKPLEINNKYEVKIEFSNNFASTGYVLKTYENHENADLKVMTFTKLREFDARRVIPCLDQINLKAKFKMWLVHPERLKGFSNAKFKSRKDVHDKPGWVKDEFYETDYMATFSMAMALAEFETTGPDPSLNVNVQTWAAEDVIEQMLYINELASKSFKFFLTLFNAAHPLKKLDILILPNVDFEIEESFGIIFISQEYVLDTLRKSSNPTTFAMVSKICHAVSYQWIGNTVTMSEWKDTWLHQGLNYFLQKECAKKIFPEYSEDILEMETIESFIAFMRSEEIAEYDEPITILRSYPEIQFMKYVTIEKIYHLIRMVYFILGPNLFNQALASYVEDFRCLNSELDDALDVFTKKANSVRPTILPYYRFKIQTIMKSWLHQTGAPLIVITRADDTNELIMKQEIFNSLELDLNYKENSNEGYWLIPLSCTSNNELKFDVVAPRVWLEDTPLRWTPGQFNQDNWILCNLDFNVPGRVLYDHETWNSIHKFFTDQDKFKRIGVLTRARIVSEMFTLAEAGELTYEIVFNTMKYLQYEEELLPWSIALKEFDLIRSRLLGSELDLLELYQKFVRSILEPAFQKRIADNFLPSPTENILEGRFQVLFVEMSCKFDLEGCLEKGSELENMWARTSDLGEELEIRRRLRRVILCEQIKQGKKEIWNSFWKSYYTEENRSSKEDLLQAFACSQKTKDLQTLLETSVSDSLISREESVIIFQSLTSNKKGYKLMKKFFQKSYDKINSFHPEGEPSQLSYLRILFNATNRMRDLNKITQFAISKKVEMNDKLTIKSTDHGRRNIVWAHRNKKDLKQVLSNVTFKKLLDKLKNKLKFK